MAFQPIFDSRAKQVHSQEALVRGGVRNEPASAVFAQVGHHNLYRFDQVCRVTAIRLAAQLGISTSLNVNFMPNAVYRPELCIRTTLEAAETYDFPADRIVFEFTEAEKIADFGHLQAIVADYRQRGFTVAMDDFGAGYAGLNLLADLQPDLVKIDMGLVRDVDQDKARRAICKGIVQVSEELGIGSSPRESNAAKRWSACRTWVCICSRVTTSPGRRSRAWPTSIPKCAQPPDRPYARSRLIAQTDTSQKKCE